MNTDTIKLYIYSPLNTDEFRNALASRFRATGHNREIEFIDWDCLNAEPEYGGDIYVYDAAMVSYMAENGYIRQLPDIIDTSDLFQWLGSTIKYKRKDYAFPVIVCCNVIICRREDDLGIENVFSLPGLIGAPVKSLISNYYYTIRCNRQWPGGEPEEQRRQRIMEYMDLLVEKIGGKEKLKDARLTKGFGIEEFNEKKIKYYVGFTESLQYLDRDDYVVRKARYSDSYEDSISLMYVNVISLGKNVNEERMLDCFDIFEIMSSPDFEYLLCNPGGHLTYMLPANRKTYEALIKEDRIYEQLYGLVADDRNFAYRINDYYKTVSDTENELLEILL